MIPTSFDESNLVLNPPEGVSVEEVGVLSVCAGTDYNGGPVLVSCWKMTIEEMAEFKRSGRVWLTVQGEAMPPVLLDCVSPFEVRAASSPDGRSSEAWEYSYDDDTRFVGGEHPRGGKRSICEMSRRLNSDQRQLLGDAIAMLMNSLRV